MIRLDLVNKSAQLVLVILLLLSVIAIFASPAVDLEPTALRAMKTAGLLVATLLLACSVVCGLLQALLGHASVIVDRHSVLAPPLDLLKLNCALLC